MIAVSIFLLIAFAVGLMLCFQEIKAIANSVQILDYEPIRIGENYQCPTCKAFWYFHDEDVHFKGCIVPIMRNARRSNVEKLRSGSDQG